MRAGCLDVQAARATVVWTELLLFVQHAEAEHAAWADTCNALRHLDWSQQLHTTMTVLFDCAQKPSRRSRSYFLGHCMLCCKAKQILETFYTS